MKWKEFLEARVFEKCVSTFGNRAGWELSQKGGAGKEKKSEPKDPILPRWGKKTLACLFPPKKIFCQLGLAVSLQVEMVYKRY